MAQTFSDKLSLIDEQIENNLNYKQKFFGVSAIDDNTVIFLGGSIEHTNEEMEKNATKIDLRSGVIFLS